MRKAKVFSFIVTFLVLALLVIAGPAQALGLSIAPFTDTPVPSGKTTSTTATISINSNEVLETLSNITLNITGPGNSVVRSCVFSLDGTELSGCEGINITLINDTTSFGYGYGYGYGFFDGILQYNITINTTGFVNGNHFVKLIVGSEESNDNPKPKFEIGGLPPDSPGGGNGGSGGGSGGAGGGNPTIFTNPQTGQPVVFSPPIQDPNDLDDGETVRAENGQGEGATQANERARGLFGRITGTAIGTLGPGGALASLVFILILVTVFVAAIVFIVQQKKSLKTTPLPQTFNQQPFSGSGSYSQGPINREFSY